MSNTEAKLMIVRSWAKQERVVIEHEAVPKEDERVTRLEMIEFLLRVLDKGEG